MEHVCRQLNNYLKVLIKEVRFKTELKLSYVLSSDTFFIQLEKLLSDNLRVNVVKFDREQHLHIPLQLLKHGRVAIFKVIEELLELLEHELLRLRWINPLSECVKNFLLENLTVFFAPEIFMHGDHATLVDGLQRLLHRATVHVQVEQAR